MRLCTSWCATASCVLCGSFAPYGPLWARLLRIDLAAVPHAMQSRSLDERARASTPWFSSWLAEAWASKEETILGGSTMGLPRGLLAGWTS